MGFVLTLFFILCLIDMFSGGMVGDAFNEAAEEKREKEATQNEIARLTLLKLQEDEDSAKLL